ncbi:MAG: potassium transporter Kup [Xanthomonadales bacterium]|nr:potassium transporter Kup [Xanthomonadales bacterium]ODU94466.1 MAG: potassium transporter Kup [Rhodanobacter sp. SCN 66-43]OJY87074.1 MAG: potassium transporter Kup [Xanthomonadales bacterium 66-474]
MHATVSDSRVSPSLRALALGAIGVVFGDIGTSPLYTLQEVFSEKYGLGVSQASVFGVLSLVFWSLMLVVTLKYVMFVMRADNKGEGGIMALLALVQRSVRGMPRLRWLVALLAIFGAALFYGDGVITPAMTVLSAVEGLKVAEPALGRWVVGISVAILLLLFALQRRGTAGIGALFGPVMCVWFTVIAVLGVHMIMRAPQILVALNPYYALRFFASHGIAAFVALGGVVLAVTGTEALYADMGHFGKSPIRRAWLGFVFPALLLNYFGQGALLLENPGAAGNPFYLLVPRVLLYPMIALATAAAVIASQAVITGAYSMTREAVQLGYSPRMRVVHTSSRVAGQIFVPWINGMLLVLVVAAVLGFRSSENLGAAYGIAVTGTMVVTTLLMLIVAVRIWRWKLPLVVAIGVALLAIDLAFFGANLLKVEHGGWFPLVLGLLVFTVMTTWRRGRELVLRQLQHGGLALAPFIASIAEHPPARVPGTAVFMTANLNAVPHALLHSLKHYKVLHARNVLLSVETLETPFADAAEHIEVRDLGHSFHALTLRFGFMEDPDVPAALAECTKQGFAFDMMDTTFFLSRETVVATRRPGMALWRDRLFAFMTRNALPATAFFSIPGNRLVELGTQVEI